jgi:ATP-binding protein involved in chromosome partitioning
MSKSRQPDPFSLVLTTPACPLKDKAEERLYQGDSSRIDPYADVNVEISSRTTDRRKDDANLLKGVRNIIAVVSGKAEWGSRLFRPILPFRCRSWGTCGAVDADIYGPSVPLMFGLMDARPSPEEDGKTILIPVEKYGIKLLSIGFFVDPSKAWYGGPHGFKLFFADADSGDWVNWITW